MRRSSDHQLPLLPLPVSSDHPRDDWDKCDRYYATSARDAFKLVLLKTGSKSDVRRTHSESASVLTHGVAAAIWIAYAIGRSALAPADASLGATLHVASIAACGIAYGVSTAFHLYKTVKEWAPWARTADFSAVYLALAVNGVAVVGIVGEGVSDGDAPVLAWLDPVLAPLIPFVFFLARRMLVSSDETRLVHRFNSEEHDPCSDHAHRVWHSDLEHVTLRQSSSFALVYGWVLLAPTAFRTMEPWLVSLWLGSALASALLLTLGATVLVGLWGLCGADRNCDVAVGNVFFCRMDPHAWWHVMACASNAVMIVAREVVLAYR